MCALAFLPQMKVKKSTCLFIAYVISGLLSLLSIFFCTTIVITVINIYSIIIVISITMIILSLSLSSLSWFILCSKTYPKHLMTRDERGLGGSMLGEWVQVLLIRRTQVLYQRKREYFACGKKTGKWLQL